MKTINGGAVLARTMSALGVKEVFALHGGHLDSFLVACAGEGIRLTDTRHEATAGYAAEAYARATGGIGVCVVTAGPGFSNAMTPMVDAWLDATPVLFITGSPPLREVATNPLQGGFDQVAMAAPVTKWAHRITNVERIPDLVDKAVRIALSGRPGPVYLEVPIDIMFGPMAEKDLVLPGRPALSARPAPSPEAVTRILDLLAAASRPAIIVGGGALSKRCAAELAEFARRTGTPVVRPRSPRGCPPRRDAVRRRTRQSDRGSARTSCRRSTCGRDAADHRRWRRGPRGAGARAADRAEPRAHRRRRTIRAGRSAAARGTRQPRPLDG